MDRDPRWHWRNCRALSLGIGVAWPFRFGIHREDDVYGGRIRIGFGPVVLGMDYDIGNRSSENPLEAMMSLSESEAYDRALAYEGRN